VSSRSSTDAGAVPGHGAAVRLRRWTDADLALLHAINTPEMTEFLVASETDAQLSRRHERYLRGWDVGLPHMFAVVDGPGRPLGSIGWWESAWEGGDCYELGWSVLPEVQGRGVATRAVRLAVEDIGRHGDGRDLMACPSVDNEASNALCRTAGFSLAGVIEEEFRGERLTLNVWVLARS